MSELSSILQNFDSETINDVLESYSYIDAIYNESLKAMGEIPSKVLSVKNSSEFCFTQDNRNNSSMKIQGGQNVKAEFQS